MDSIRTEGRFCLRLTFLSLDECVGLIATGSYSSDPATLAALEEGQNGRWASLPSGPIAAAAMGVRAHGDLQDLYRRLRSVSRKEVVRCHARSHKQGSDRLPFSPGMMDRTPLSRHLQNQGVRIPTVRFRRAFVSPSLMPSRQRTTTRRGRGEGEVGGDGDDESGDE